MKKLRVAVIGCGNIFPVHADAIVENENAELTAVVDIDKDKAIKAAEKYNCRYYTSHHALLTEEEIDAAHICTPHHLHAVVAIDLLKKGVDVLTEKPLAINTGQGEHMIRTAGEYKRNLGICYQNRFNENNRKAFEIISSGQLGKVRGIKGIVTWFRDQSYYQQADWRGKFSTEGGGVLINQAIHTLDLMQLFGGKVEAIQGNTATRCLGSVIEVEDTADATIFFESGAVGIFFATNCFSSNSPVRLEIDCDRGRLILDGDNLLVETSEGSNEYKNSSCSGYKSYWGDSHRLLIDGFYQDLINKENRYLVSAEEGLQTLKMIETIYRSAESGIRERL